LELMLTGIFLVSNQAYWATLSLIKKPQHHQVTQTPFFYIAKYLNHKWLRWKSNFTDKAPALSVHTAKPY
jgi:hypothetical protein